MEEQGWLAWFMICALKKAGITIYGNGKQVRDVLFVDDLVRAYELAAENIEKTRGQVYNIGGGTKNSVSIWHDCFSIIEKLFHTKLKAKTSKERPGDQQIFIADTRKALRDFGWKPTTSIQQGTKQLYNWLLENKEYFLS